MFVSHRDASNKLQNVISILARRNYLLAYNHRVRRLSQRQVERALIQTYGVKDLRLVTRDTASPVTILHCSNGMNIDTYQIAFVFPRYRTSGTYPPFSYQRRGLTN